MRSIYRFLWVVPVLALGSGLLPGSADEAAPLERGSVLILRSERTWEGDIRHRNRRYYVHRDGAEIASFKESDVLCLCANWSDACSFMKSRTRDDVQDHVRLAKWCSINHLYKEALDEAEAALSLNTEHKEARLLCVVFEKMYKQKVLEAKQPPPQQPTEAPAEIDIGPDLRTLFDQNVQPILLSRCLECHNPTKASKFELQNPARGSQKEATLRNLHAVLKQLDRERPLQSRLLEKAMEFHNGIAKSPFRIKSDPNYRALEDWVERVTAKPWNEVPAGTIAAANPARDGPGAVTYPRTVSAEPDDTEPLGSVLPGDTVVSRVIPRYGNLDNQLLEARGGVGRLSLQFAADMKQGSWPASAAQSSTVRHCWLPPFPDRPAIPQLEHDSIIPIGYAPGALLKKTMPPPFPPYAAAPRDLPQAVRAKAQPLMAEAPKRQAVPSTASPAFQFHPAPEPTIEVVRPEPATDEFDPRLFPSK